MWDKTDKTLPARHLSAKVLRTTAKDSHAPAQQREMQQLNAKNTSQQEYLPTSKEAQVQRLGVTLE